MATHNFVVDVDMEIVNFLNNETEFIEGETFKQKLEDLKHSSTHLYENLPSSKQCSDLSTHLQEVFELREELNRLEQGLLQTHLRCCISPNLKIPAEVVLATSILSARRHGAIIVIEQEKNLESPPCFLPDVFYSQFCETII
jgi:DNA integrity scanning protein DisA with diadenylate cyclase activity